MQESGTEQLPAPARKTCPAAGSHLVARAATAHPLHRRALQAAAARHQLQEKRSAPELTAFLTSGDEIQLQYCSQEICHLSCTCSGYCQGLNGQSGIPACWHCWCVCDLGHSSDFVPEAVPEHVSLFTPS